MGKRGVALPKEVYWQARQMYAQKNQWGQPIMSYMEIAAKLGISETSVMRAVKNQGRFANIEATPLPEPKSEQQLKIDAAASLERFLAMQKAEEAAPKRVDPFELMAQQSQAEAARRTSPPPSPLDGGDAPDETGGAGVTKLVEINTAGDALLDELKQSTQGEKK